MAANLILFQRECAAVNTVNAVCYIVGAMPLEPQLVPRPKAGDLVIAADGGYAGLTQWGVMPDLVVGDFDSLGRVPEHPAVCQLPCEKDDTDTGHAIQLALERGYTRFVLLGCLGGRLDHTVANLQLLNDLAHRGASGLLVGNGQAAAAVTNGSICFPAEFRGFCSVFCLEGTAEGVTLEGLKYSMTDGQLTERFPLGVSNEFLGVPAQVSVTKGTLLLIWETDGPLRALTDSFFS